MVKAKADARPDKRGAARNGGKPGAGAAPVSDGASAEAVVSRPKKRRRFLPGLLVTLLIVAVAGYLAFSRHSAPSSTNDFDAAFSPRGIYEELQR